MHLCHKTPNSVAGFNRLLDNAFHLPYISSMTTTDTVPDIGTDKVRENRLRRAAQRQELRLEKSRARDSRDTTYGTYQLRDLSTDTVVRSRLCHRRGFGLSLEEVEDFLPVMRCGTKPLDGER